MYSEAKKTNSLHSKNFIQYSYSLFFSDCRDSSVDYLNGLMDWWILGPSDLSLIMENIQFCANINYMIARFMLESFTLGRRFPCKLSDIKWKSIIQWRIFMWLFWKPWMLFRSFILNCLINSNLIWIISMHTYQRRYFFFFKLLHRHICLLKVTDNILHKMCSIVSKAVRAGCNWFFNSEIYSQKTPLQSVFFCHINVNKWWLI